MIMKKIFLFLLLFSFFGSSLFAQIELPNSYSKEQKLYELSFIWKEVSYNFDNFDHCPDLNVDSLYFAYIPVIENTQNDLEYFKVVQRFMASFHNPHNCLGDFPCTMDSLLARIYIKAAYKNGKLIVTNIPGYLSGKIKVNDEILKINGVDAIQYVKENHVPYFSASDEENKLSEACEFKGLGHTYPYMTKFDFTVKSTDGIKNVELFADRKIGDNDKWILHNFDTDRNNTFLIDAASNTAYIRLVNCSESSARFFQDHIPDMENCKTLILDLYHNWGGNSNDSYKIYEYLIKNDTIKSYPVKSRIHIPFLKGKGADRPEDENFKPYYLGTQFVEIGSPGPKERQLYAPDSVFKGKVIVLTGRETVSAGEDLVTTLSQDTGIVFIGHKTAGGTGRPYIFTLPSGIKIFINTLRTYDYLGNETSAGIKPDYTVDLDDLYLTEKPGLFLKKLIKTVNETLKEKKRD